MRLEANLSQRLEQRMQLSQQMLQNLELLQLPLLQLRQKIDEELEINPALDLTTELEDRSPETVAEAAGPAPTPETEETVEDRKREFLESVEEEWFASERRTPRGGGDEDKKFEYLQNVGAPSLGIRDHLRAQLAVLEVDASMGPYLELLIEHIDDNGYLSAALEEIAQAAPPEIRRLDPEVIGRMLETALSFLQKLEPRGIGARSPRECLILQLDEADANFAAKRRLIDRHLEDIGHNRLPKMVREICADPAALADFGLRPGTDPAVVLEDVKTLIAEIQKLNPKPGATHSAASTPRVFPEVLIRKVDGTYEIVIEDSYLPPLSINRSYQELLKGKTLAKDEKDYIRRKIDAGRKLISAIEQRRSTIQRITAEILRHQMDFFEQGAEHLRPLKMQEVADDVGIHVSTVSRAISGKWIETPRGIFPMKFFFASAAPKAAPPLPGAPAAPAGAPEDDRTRLALMDRIREILDGEDRKNPLSDLEIVRILKAQGINAARRTIAKYREEMGIPSSRVRRQY